MKCNNCNAEVTEGMKFCPECGNSIEQPQPQKCPQCSIDVAEGTKFCPNCGSPIGIPKPKVCSKCGTEIEEGEKFCSNCGTPTGSTSIPQSQVSKTAKQGGTSLHLCWDGERKQPLWSNPIFVYANNQKCGEFIPKSTFEKTFSNVNPNFEIQLEFGKGPFNKTDIKLDLENGHNYTCVFFINGAGTFGYELKDENDRLIKEDGNLSLWLLLVFLIIPLVGFIYFFIKKNEQPIIAKLGLIFGFGNLVLTLLRFLF
jgi:RNA polymerase subunit RPABC4/transcription elongation factor Spt4